MRRRFTFLAIVCLTLLGGCGRTPDTGVTALRPATLDELKEYLLNRKPDFDQFRLRGPYSVKVLKDRGVRLSATERIEADLYLSASPGKAPLVVLLHGLDNSKETHAYQARHLASWGMHCLTVQLPNDGPWIGNGRTLAGIVALIHAQPQMIDSRIDPERIILVGHSFGGFSVAIALAEGAPAAGGILLDPAGASKGLPIYLAKIRAPVMVIAADERVSAARNRHTFYDSIPGNVARVSIAGAAHEDAEFPLETGLSPPGTHASAIENAQNTFVGALASAAFSLGFTGKLDFAWASFGEAVRSGRMMGALRK